MSKIKKKYNGVVLAAGYSSRMKDWKPKIVLEHEPIIIRTIKPMLEYCHKVIVVGGFNFNKLLELIYEFDYLSDREVKKIVVIDNKYFMNGMFTSVQKGLISVDEYASGVFIMPGDIPFVKKETFKKLVNIFNRSVDKDVLIPITLQIPEVYLGKAKLRKGHPLLISRKVATFAIRADQNSNLREVINNFKKNYCYVDDKGIIFDLDVKSDLNKADKYLISLDK